MRQFKPMSRKNQKLIYKLFQSYAAYLSSNSPYRLPTVYWSYEAKKELKKLYMEATKEIRSEKPLEKLQKKIKETLEEGINKSIATENKIDIILEDILLHLRNFISDLAIELGSAETFSLALKLCDNTRAIKFTEFILEYYVDNQIPVTKETERMLAEDYHDKLIYSYLKNKRCAICGSTYNVHFEHYIPVSRTHGTYSKDDGTGVYWSLCADCHGDKHNAGESEYTKKTGKKGIYLNKEQIKEIKKIYPNHLKGFKEEI